MITKAKIKGLPVNINTTVAVRLTKAGMEIAKKEKPPLMVDKRHFTTELWHLMQVFGPHICHGCEVPFVDCEIVLGEITVP